MIQWLLKKGEDRRLRSGHPWVFSNELSSNPKGVVPGDPIEILDNKGNFVARGYGNPYSLISFRALTWRESENSNNLDFIKKRLMEAWRYRNLCGFNSSFRLCFAEGDSLPGLIIDRYLLVNNYQVLCVQLLTSGMQRLLGTELVIFLESLAQDVFNENISLVESKNTFVVLRNDVNIRKLEGLQVESPIHLKSFSSKLPEEVGLNLRSCDILVDTPIMNKHLSFTVDLIEGQKTGFFLDQRSNIFQVLEYLRNSPQFLNYKTSGLPIRILDLCCYAGHWSAQLAHYLKDYNVEITLVDISEDALRLSSENVKKYTDNVQCLKLDVVKDLDQIRDNYYNVVIADPPAFIKAKKDIPQGSHAYLKVNTHSFRVAAYKGIIVSCTCSGLLIENEFHDIVRKSQQRAGHTSYRVLFSGGHS
jgi:23S rRNA (cytosine1962-C5)-methyltransferase